MHWAVDAQRLAGQRLGVGRYIEYLVKHWERMVEGDDRVTLFVREPLERASLTSSSAFDVRAPGPKLTGKLWENFVLPRAAADIDVLFCPSYSVPLTYRGKSVVAIHSMNEVQSGTHPWWYKYTYTPLYRSSAHHADAVIVPSQSTKDDLQTYYGVPAEKISIVVQGADEAFQPMHDEELLRQTRIKFIGSDRPYFLWVGKLSQRRNIPALLEAFAMLKKRTKLPHALFLCGPNHLGLPLDGLVRDLGIENDVIQDDAKFASHHEIVPVYNAAAAYVNASSYEGFSMTLVEALSCGVPVVGVDRAAVGEIARGAALLVPEPDPELLADAMERVVTDDVLRADLSKKSLARAEQYRWNVTARQTLDVLRRVAAA